MENMFDKIDEIENKITLQSEEGEPIDFYVLEETKLNGENFLLVTDLKRGTETVTFLAINQNQSDAEAGNANPRGGRRA